MFNVLLSSAVKNSPESLIITSLPKVTFHLEIYRIQSQIPVFPFLCKHNSEIYATYADIGEGVEAKGWCGVNANAATNTGVL